MRGDAQSATFLDEPVTLAPYDARWPETFEGERRRLCEALEIAPDSLEHIGSTAVPGMLAKPVVDLMLGVPTYPPLDALVSRLEILGYQDMGEAGVPERRYLRLRGQQAFNLHIMARDGGHWSRNLRLRDYLRRDEGARARYAAAKQSAVAAGRTRLLGYSDAKRAVLAELLSTSD